MINQQVCSKCGCRLSEKTTRDGINIVCEVCKAREYLDYLKNKKSRPEWITSAEKNLEQAIKENNILKYEKH